jgi:hypothetical protein
MRKALAGEELCEYQKARYYRGVSDLQGKVISCESGRVQKLYKIKSQLDSEYSQKAQVYLGVLLCLHLLTSNPQ